MNVRPEPVYSSLINFDVLTLQSRLQSDVIFRGGIVRSDQ
jgi:hypothetical protein